MDLRAPVTTDGGEGPSDRLSHFKCLLSVRFADDLPRLPSGKLLKRLLA